MAVEGVMDSPSKKPQGGFAKKKMFFGINERVELRSVEDGFLGSWHPGIVIHCEKLKRLVRYDNILDDDEINNLEELVNVSEALDGQSSSSDFYKRGFIRPVPPLIEFDKRNLKFGVCVDVNYQEAWWEGVIFDHNDEKEERSVFFPDLGDEMNVEIHQLRITQDWDEVAEKWEQRGKWVFLELIEECERTSFVGVSAKQIWYDVRGKSDFNRIGEWTFNVKDLWRDMVLDVVDEYFSLTAEEVFSVLNLPRSLFNETPEVESVEPVANGDLNTTLPEKEILMQKDPLPPFEEKFQVLAVLRIIEKNISSTRSRSGHWKPLKFSEVELCPDAVKQYALGSKSIATRKLWTKKVHKHLAYLGWKIEWTSKFRGYKRYRYKSPDEQDQKFYLSLTKVCKVMQNNSKTNFLMSQNDESIMHHTFDSHLSHVPLNPSEKIQDPDTSLATLPPPPVEVVDEPEFADEPAFCPQAVVEYYNAFKKNRTDKRKWIQKAKKHLLAEGWTLEHHPTNKRRGIKYICPQKKIFLTLHAACGFCIKESIPKWTNSGMQLVNENDSVINEENVDQVQNGYLLNRVSQLPPEKPALHGIDGVAASGSTANRKRKRLSNSKASLPKRQRNGLPVRVLRSSKRVQEVSTPSLSHQKPQNVLSWLIDHNVVLPRSKVYYLEKSRYRAMAEGRITRDGIKCNCCQTVYSLVGFEKHASGSSTPRPAANIFLEDYGRSLLDCQIQIMQDYRIRETKEKPCNGLFQGENDYICSVCHYGGELILCDQCPSSFHKTCLGLEDIPDGDWFCPSCRCGICGQSKINGDEDGHFLACTQCENKYHVRCVKSRAVDESRRYQENWFCGKKCEKIYEGLNKLLGVPVTVGLGNLTWTLVKFSNSESCNLGSAKSELLAESYCKLNVALSVMHECFEPLKEPFSSRDLVEDVIFSRWSELNRLNFQGFYTVLLERNEELISVATIRIYGDKVAEIPLVGTRLQYRRHGMCRILMNELEKKLMQLGVERLVLPAIPSVLETWTSAFGFAEMTNFERSEFLDHTFLDFQGTIMCQKWLEKIPSPDSVLSKDSQLKQIDVFNGSCSVDFDKPCPDSEVYQAKEIDKRGMMDQQMREYVSPRSI
ncbi:uncharacterized protein LOC133293509 [Gastrolobium bilobum]|uniref:uncharacterized protein LOC133293509 n=1 Tax=Gastrolobium bilobum TaxID=150636 RepID=UPI002AB03909|nr:uncharacterized protein LOC133293509 [Gastrolobium bilobum]